MAMSSFLDNLYAGDGMNRTMSVNSLSFWKATQNFTYLYRVTFQWATEFSYSSLNKRTRSRIESSMVIGATMLIKLFKSKLWRKKQNLTV